MEASVYSLDAGSDRRLNIDAAVELVRALELEIPASFHGKVEIIRAVRIPGLAAKVAVRSHDPYVRVPAVLIGSGGERIRHVEQRIGNDAIQVVPYSEDRAAFVRAALRPAFAGEVVVTEDGFEVHPAEGDAGRVIGKGGVNVALASALVRCRIHVIAPDAALLEASKAVV